MRNFTVQKVLFSNDGSRPIRKCKKHVYEYNESDMVWYRDDTDESYYMEKPKNGEKTFTLKNEYHARLLVKSL